MITPELENQENPESESLNHVISIPVNTKDANSAIWSGYDSRVMLFFSQITFSLIAVGFGMYLIIDSDGKEGYLTVGSSLITYVLGFLTKNPVIGKRGR